MAQSVYTGVASYLIYAEDSAWGSAGTPTGSDYVDQVTSFSASVTNNIIRTQGFGTGRNATSAVNGILDVSGSIEWELTDPAFLQYCFIGSLAGSGTAADPYEIQEVNQIGYAAGQVNTLTLEVGHEGGSNDDTMTYDGVVINSFSLNVNVGEVAKCSADWIARTVNSSTSVETYSGPSNSPLTFVDGALTVGSDTVGNVQSFSLTCANNIQTFRGIGSRLIAQPVAGIRRYDFSMTLKLDYNDTASVLSGLEARGIVFNGTPTGTTPLDDSQNTAVAVSIDLVEGAVAGDRVVNFDFENCYFESYTEPLTLEDGFIEITINGFAMSGRTDGAAKGPCRFYTVA